MCMSEREAGLGERDKEFCFRCPKFRWFGASQLSCECLDLGTVRAVEDKMRAEAIPWNAATAPYCEKSTAGSLPGKESHCPNKGSRTSHQGSLHKCRSQPESGPKAQGSRSLTHPPSDTSRYVKIGETLRSENRQ